MHRHLPLLATAILAVWACGAMASDQVPGTLPEGPVAIVGATIHTVSGEVIPSGTLVFNAGKITAIGEKVKVPKKATVIKAQGKHVYPGLFEPYSRIGLSEINSVRASNDYRETGTLNPNVKAHVSVDADSELIPVTRSNGVLLAMSAPTGGLIAGQGSILQLDGWTYEELTLKPQAAMVVSLRSDGDRKSLADFFDQARQYTQATEAKVNVLHDERLSAMREVILGTQPIIVAADRWPDIARAVAFANEQKVKLVILGGADATKCADLLKQYDIPVIVSAVHRVPASRDEPYDAAYTLPRRLQELGIRFCISGYERSESWNVRNLPYHAATAAGFGLAKEDAIRAITLAPAEILGVADQVGSLEVGKDATLIVCDGDPLETTTQTHAAWIQGKPVDLNDKQKMLHDKYQQKYQRTGD